MTGPLLVLGGQARQIVCSLRRRIGYLRDQVHLGRVHHQRVLEHLDFGHQEFDSGAFIM